MKRCIIYGIGGDVCMKVEKFEKISGNENVYSPIYCGYL